MCAINTHAMRQILPTEFDIIFYMSLVRYKLKD